MARNSPRVGPRFPQVVVLVGATGDLSRRKLLPGLFHLAQRRLHPRLPDHRRLARRHRRRRLPHARPRGARPVLHAQGRARPMGRLRRELDYVPLAAGAAALKAAVARRSSRSAARAAACIISACRPAAALPAVRLLAEADLVSRLPDHHGKALRHRPRERGRAQRAAARGLLRGADFPHRPFPRQGGGAEHPGLPLRQRPVRADLEPQLHRPRADRRAGDAGPRQARRRSTSRPAPIATWW